MYYDIYPNYLYVLIFFYPQSRSRLRILLTATVTERYECALLRSQISILYRMDSRCFSIIEITRSFPMK